MNDHERIAVLLELYPAESRLVDTANQFHMWVVEDRTFRFPFGFTERAVGGQDDPVITDALRKTGIDTSKARQRPFTKGGAT